MNRLVLAALIALTLPASAFAVICKTIDADGVVSYAEVPASECPQAVKLPDYSRYAPRPIAQTPPVAGAGGAPETPFAGYTSIAIVTPPANGTVRNNEGRVAVAIDLQPGLQPGHRVTLYLDARAVAGDFDSTSIELSGVERGTHSLRAQVRDAAGRVQIDSPSILFTLRKRGLFDGPAPAEPPETPEPGFPSEEEKPNQAFLPAENPNPGFVAPDDSPDYSPESPNYTPPGGGISSTPGKTNPAFAPKYTP